LTLDERNDFPTAWTSDSRAVLFWSDRSDQSQIFKQNIDQQTAETIVAGPEEAWMPRVTPDGMSILYLASPQGLTVRTEVADDRSGSHQVARIMRVRSSGVGPDSVMEVPRLGNCACPRRPSDVCFLGQSSEDGKKLIISTFDPMQGNAREVRTLDIHAGALYNWMPSPDGSRIVDYNPMEGNIRLPLAQGRA
jgi:hypothetical protein